MAEPNKIEVSKAPAIIEGMDSKSPDVSIAVDERAVIPKGTIDPVYEAKARVLNHAVS